MLTQEQKNKWLVRLRDPNSKQARWEGVKTDHSGFVFRINLRGHEPMCCLVHGAFTLGLDHVDYCNSMTGLIGRKTVDDLIDMNDSDGKSLEEIAAWIEMNVDTVEDQRTDK